ncbi:tat pathway signal sequence [Colletotrichum scovillei]|uniref:Tat pathway signal sequence n=1 Tax=Colletotrichum scovillei TaxID=1209932 RepID=A0A9P7RF73_9PEZI|nr:tat pathway signal sequence [Colletotrichum scovillei]KAF4785213.1 tat pathway signal sequence [Colletotrichum scovillei]KAG7054901.1 tat pathway signal sequence [Colletotrichum scovillei]KAG7074283.1 tat pathway signal sequence [Colletotrichum scovillei]KAG7081073.1 tat pathway signal sequence [Colletotrichum scovillei]
MSFTTSSSVTLPVPVVENVHHDLQIKTGDENNSELTLTPPTKVFFPPSSNSSTHTLVVTDGAPSQPPTPPASSSSVDDTDDEDDEIPVPSKKGTRPYRYLRWNFGSVYRRIFSLAFFGNIAALIFVIIRSLIGGIPLTPQTCATAVSANILAALFIRNEHTVNALFKLFVLFPSAKAPLRIRRTFAKIYSYGGIHSGCGVASFFWFVAFLVVLTAQLKNPSNAVRAYILLDSYLICALLAAIIGFAHPRARVLLHNWFEGTHRFLGWSVIVFFWALVLMLAADDSTTAGTPYAVSLILTPSFWMLIVITLLVAYPWTRLRLRDVEAEAMSDHVVKLNFNYADVHYGQAVRLTDAPLRETHAFAVIPNPAAPSTDIEKAQSTGGLSNAGKKGFSVLVSNAGDWTNKIIKNPPKKIWTRGVPQYGVLRVAGLFEPCIVIATGSGIGPCLSLFVQRPDHPVRIIWSTQRPAETYGQGVIDALYRADPDAVIIDTKKTGRPDLVAITYRIWESSRRQALGLAQNEGVVTTKTNKNKMGPCEAVVIISNQKVTRKVVYGLESRGIPAYGAIFDS